MKYIFSVILILIFYKTEIKFQMKKKWLPVNFVEYFL